MKLKISIIHLGRNGKASDLDVSQFQNIPQALSTLYTKELFPQKCKELRSKTSGTASLVSSTYKQHTCQNHRV